MKTAQLSDIPSMAALLVRAYKHNPTVVRVVGEHAGFEKRAERLFRYTLRDMVKQQAAYITNNGTGIAVLYPILEKKSSLWTQLQVVLRASGFKRGLAAMQREKIIRSIRPKGNYLHFWMLAVDPEQKGIASVQEMRDFAFELSASEQLPIYAETPLPRTKALYERYGFVTYNKWQDGEYTVWFLKRIPAVK